jgi:uncharacterized protein (DUF58 family)
MVLIALAALNTGNNLMYLILAMMFAILAISYVFLKVNLKGLSLSVSLEQPVYARQSAEMNLTVTNTKRFISSYSLKIIFPNSMHGEGYVPSVLPGSKVMVPVEVTFRKRGIYAYGDFLVESSFPFIFFTKKISARVEGEAIVYPEIKEVEVARLFKGEGEDSWTMRAGQSDELLTIREFRTGDDIKLVHWKASAKSDKLLVREFAEEEPRMVSIILEDSGRSAPVAFERAIGYAASAAWKFLEEGFFVRLITCKKMLPFGNGNEHLFKLLDILAGLEESPSDDCPAAAEELKGGTLLILKNRNTSFKELVPVCDVVVYAAGL